MEERQEIMALLPTELPRDVMERLVHMVQADNALGGGELLEFHREQYVPEDEYNWFLPGSEPKHKRMWAARCTCGACGESWQSGWVDTEMFLAFQEDEGAIFRGVPDGESSDPVAGISVGDTVNCPMCEEPVEAISRASLKNGRTYQCMVGRVEALGDFTAVVFWMLFRYVRSDAVSTYSAEPWMAIVIGRKGDIYRFHHTQMGFWGKRTAGEAWTYSPKMGEPFDSRYYRYGAINGTMIGGFMDDNVPDQTGKTGEKTGLVDYVRSDGKYPLAYLLRQKRRPYLENLVRSGWTQSVDCGIWTEIRDGTRMLYVLNAMFDLKKPRPHDMLGMTREEVRRFGADGWDVNMLKLWRAQPCAHAAEFSDYVRRYDRSVLAGALDVFPLTELRRIDAYLRRQQKRGDIHANQAGLVMYRDYRRMLAEVSGGAEASEIEKFPPDLRRAHDRMTAAYRATQSSRFDKRFAEIAEQWKPLEWSDGAICAVLPRNGFELTEEGRTLHHCVGGYAETHASGQIIVFIRHARRPERSWFTLNIDLTGTKWHEIQLHGYGNEYAHGKRLRIPQEVRDFVDRWEKEVLTPTFAKVKATEKKAAEKKTVKKKVKAA